MRIRNPELRPFAARIEKLGRRLASSDRGTRRELAREERRTQRETAELLESIHPILARTPDGESTYETLERALSEQRPGDALAALARVPPMSLLAWMRRYLGLAGLLVTLLIAAPGVACIMIGMHELTTADASRSWSTTRGRIEASSIVRHSSSSTSGGTKYSSGSSRTTVWYVGAVRYSYEVRGQRFEGDRVGFGEDLTQPGAAAVVAKYPAGAEVDVHFDPADPGSSALEPGRNEHTSILVFGGIAWLGALLGALGGVRYHYLRRGF